MGTFINNIPKTPGRSHPYRRTIDVITRRSDLTRWQAHTEGVRKGKTSWDKELDILTVTATSHTGEYEVLLHIEYCARGANIDDFTKEGGILDVPMSFSVVTRSSKRQKLCECPSTFRACVLDDV